MIGPTLQTDRGAVTAELAIALMSAVAVLVLACGALLSAGQHVRLQGAAADAARLAARGDSLDRAHGLVSSAVPGASLEIREDGDLVCATATGRGSLPVDLSASSCALAGGG